MKYITVRDLHIWDIESEHEELTTNCSNCDKTSKTLDCLVNEKEVEDLDIDEAETIYCPYCETKINITEL